MTAFTTDQWLILALVFVFGLFLGMALLASPKWKRRYREEVTRREAVEAENAQLRRDASEMDSLRHAAARDEARRRPDVVAAPVVAAGEPVRSPAEAEALRDEADRVEADHPGEAESLRRAAARDEVRRRDDDRDPL